MGRTTASLRRRLASSNSAISSHLTAGFRCKISLSSTSARSLSTPAASYFFSPPSVEALALEDEGLLFDIPVFAALGARPGRLAKKSDYLV